MPAPATGYAPMSGTSGRVKSFSLTPSATLDFTPTFGTGTTAALGNLKKWTLESQVESGESATFESEQTDTGLLAPAQVQGGIIRYSGTLEGDYDANSATGQNSDARLVDGCFVRVDLIMHKGNGWGYYNVLVKIMGGGVGPEVGPTLAPFRKTFKVSGKLPLPSFGP